MLFRIVCHALPALIAGGLGGSPACAEDPSPELQPSTQPKTVVVAAGGGRYGAGWLHRALLGGEYRRLWVAPIRVEVVDLQSFAGGLSVKQRTGGQQTKGLRFDAADGRRFKFRLVDKDPQFPNPWAIPS